MSKTAVMLKKGWPGEFHRTVRDSSGQPVKDEAGSPQVLTFQPGQVVELDAAQLEAVRDDVGKALFLVKVEKDAKPVPKADNEATRKFVDETNKRRAKEAEERSAEKKAPPEDKKPVAVHHGQKVDLERKGK